ncbi:hypothetical protein ACLOJK_022197 [Asimina triloba]
MVGRHWRSKVLPQSLCSGVHCCWIEQGMMKMGAMVDAARETLPKGFDAGDAAGRSGPEMDGGTAAAAFKDLPWIGHALDGGCFDGFLLRLLCS